MMTHVGRIPQVQRGAFKLGQRELTIVAHHDRRSSGQASTGEIGAKQQTGKRIAVIGAEFLAASDWGLGWVIFDAKEFLNADIMIASLIAVS